MYNAMFQSNFETLKILKDENKGNISSIRDIQLFMERCETSVNKIKTHSTEMRDSDYR